MTESKKLLGWQPKAKILEHYPIGWRKLEELVSNGWIRAFKTGNNQRCTRLYRIRDIEGALLSISKNKTPRIVGLVKKDNE